MAIVKMINSSQFTISGSWTQTSNNFLVDKTTNLAYPDINENDMRAKSAALTVSTPFTHLVLSVANIGFRVLRIACCYHLWKEIEGEKEYNLRARVQDTGKDFLYAISQPFAFVALEIVSITGLFKPYDAMRAYFHIENLFYQRPFMAQMLNFAPIEYKSDEELEPETTVQDFSQVNPSSLAFSYEEAATSTPNSLPLVIDEPEELEPLVPPTLEERIADVITLEESEELPSVPRYVDRCMVALAEHFIDSYENEDFDTWLSEKKTKIQKQANAFRLNALKDNTIYSHIAEKLIDQALAENSSHPMQRFETVPVIKDAIADELKKRLSNPDIENCLPLLAIIRQMPDASEIVAEKEAAIVTKYQDIFKQMLTGETDPKFTADLINLENVIDTLKEEGQEKILVELLKSRFNSADIDLIERNFAGNEIIISLLSAIKTIRDFVGTDNLLGDFISKVKPVLDQIEGISVTSPSQKYFLIQLREFLEEEARKIHDPLQAFEFNLQDFDQAALNRGIQDAVNRINAAFDLKIELKIKMKTEQDALVTALISIFPDQSEAVREWINTRPETYNLTGFQNWLLADQLYATIAEIDPPERIEDLYLRFIQESVD